MCGSLCALVYSCLVAAFSQQSRAGDSRLKYIMNIVKALDVPRISLSKQLAELDGGTLNLKSELGKGSTVSVGSPLNGLFELKIIFPNVRFGSKADIHHCRQLRPLSRVKRTSITRRLNVR